MTTPFKITTDTSDRSAIEGYFHNNGIAFTKRAVDDEFNYIAFLTSAQYLIFKADFPETSIEIRHDLSQDAIMDNDEPLPHLEATRPDESPAKFPVYTTIAFGVVLVILVTLAFL